MTAVADFANHQPETAGKSLDHGPGATTPPPNGKTMTADQEREFVTQGMKKEWD